MRGGGERSPRSSDPAPRLNKQPREHQRWVLGLWPLFGLWLAELLIAAFDFGWGLQRSLVYALVLAGIFFLRRPGQPLDWRARRLRVAASVLGLALSAWHVGVLVAESPKRIEIDVASTTIAAGDLMFQGKNPYRIPIDYRPEITARVNTHGYKYGPVMAVVYRPFVVLLGDNGVRIANLCMEALVVAIIALLTMRLAGGVAAWVAVLLYLSFSGVPALLYIEPFNDFVAVIPLGIAFLILDGRPFLTGLMAGLSISAKLVPGAVIAPFLLPTTARARVLFLGGLLTGLLPSIALFAISPADFTGNIITFTFLRLVDTTSWMYDLPHWVPQVAKAAAALFFLACVGAVTLVPRRFDLRGRIIAAVACTIAITLVGFGVRRNYVLWWLPFATVLAAAHAVSFLPGKRLPFSVSPLAHPREDSCER